MSELEDFRAEKDEFFGTHPQSPLTPEQKRGFKGLTYFPENEAMRLEVEVERLFDQQPMQMQTSTGGVQTYVRHSRFKFEVEGQEAELTIYQNEHGYFLPFVDSLAGRETYLPGAIWSRRSCMGIASWSISTWPITRIVPTMKCGPVRSRRQRTD